MTKQQTFREFVNERFAGKISRGAHEPDGEACVLEARSQYLGLEWTESPEIVGMPDIRGLNDCRHWRDDKTRTEWMIRLHDALSGWNEWGEKRQERFIDAVAPRIQALAPADVEVDLASYDLELMGFVAIGQFVCTAAYFASAEGADRLLQDACSILVEEAERT